MDNVTPSSPPGEAPLAATNYPALVLGTLLIVVIILGNVLVCVSVLTEPSLKTATNYFIISLAAADLLLAVLVLPLYVYSEFLGGVWTLSLFICDVLMSMDVMLCTASILNLCAISVDRYIAVVVPLKYNRNQFSVRQLALIAATWALSLGVASPVMFGLNQVPNRDPRVCKLEDDRFVVYSSVCSFFLPCPLMLFLYYWMFRGLRRWSIRSRSHQVGRRGLSVHLGSALPGATDAAAGRKKVVYWLRPIGHSSPSKVAMETTGVAPLADESQSRTAVADSDPMTPPMDGVSDGGRENTKRRRTSKSSRVSGKERKAMKVLPVVVGVFLACWTPFFTVHITKVLCRSCHIGPALISVVTWLGYVNSAINPIIYTIFNPEFRNVFYKLLCCRT